MIRPETYFSKFAHAELYESPLLTRIRMAKIRCKSYPVDSMDFIMADLERPETLKRHADFCTGDLTGRYLDFLTATMHLDSSDSDRLDTLFNRILKCQAPNGAFGRPYSQDMGVSERELIWGASYRLFTGLLRYHALNGNVKALTAAVRNAEYFISHLDEVKDHCERLKKSGNFDIMLWIAEPFAALYSITGDERCLQICQLVADALPQNINRCHTHGLMTTLRGLQFAAMYSGDMSFNELPEKFIKEIGEQSIWPDGNVAEMLPKSPRNEGCAIADWVLLNLYSGFITGNDEAYERAENALYNALFLNQLVNGGFGTRELDSDQRGYSKGELSEECWWCCVHTSGLAMTEFADHAVTIRDGELRVNLLLPGKYTLQNRGHSIVVEIMTRYPETADTIIFVSGADETIRTRIRIPKWIKTPVLKKDDLPGGTQRFKITGKMGYELENVKGGVILRYGPLVMVPLHYDSTSRDYIDYSKTSVPKDYVPETMPQDRPAIVPVEKDADGFLVYAKDPYPTWQCYEEGTISRLAYEKLSINVPLYFADGKIRIQRFFPECNSTATLIGFDLPLIFNDGEAAAPTQE